MSTTSSQDARAVLLVEQLMDKGIVITSFRNHLDVFVVKLGLPNGRGAITGIDTTFPDALALAVSEIPADADAA